MLESDLPSPSGARRSPQLHPITGEPPSKRKAAARSLRPLQPLNRRPGSAGQLASHRYGELVDGRSDSTPRQRPSSQPSSPQELGEARELRKLYAAQISYTQQRSRCNDADDDDARQEAARVAAAAVQATRDAAASSHAELIRQHHAASVIQAAERCRAKCDEYIEIRWAAAMIQRVERGRRARRRRRLLEQPWVVQEARVAPGVTLADGDNRSATLGALWRMAFHSAAQMASSRAAELRDRGEGPWSISVERWDADRGMLLADTATPERQLEAQALPGHHVAVTANQADRNENVSGRDSSLNTTVELRSLAAEGDERARLEAMERSRVEAAQARAAVRERRKTVAQEQNPADAGKHATQAAAATAVQRHWRSRQRQLAADQFIQAATITVQAAWRGYALRTQLQWVHSIACGIQAAARGWMVRHQLCEIRRLEARASAVQKERARIAAAMAEALGGAAEAGKHSRVISALCIPAGSEDHLILKTALLAVRTLD